MPSSLPPSTTASHPHRERHCVQKAAIRFGAGAASRAIASDLTVVSVIR
jgi:hypothetical protein